MLKRLFLAFALLLPALTLADFRSQSSLPFNVAAPTDGQCLVYQASTNTWINSSSCGGGGGGSGTVTSVQVTPPTGITGTDCTITTAGNCVLAYSAQSANTVFAGPVSGGATTPTWRTLVIGSDVAAVTGGQLPTYSSPAAGDCAVTWESATSTLVCLYIADITPSGVLRGVSATISASGGAIAVGNSAAAGVNSGTNTTTFPTPGVSLTVSANSHIDLWPAVNSGNSVTSCQDGTNTYSQRLTAVTNGTMLRGQYHFISSGAVAAGTYVITCTYGFSDHQGLLLAKEIKNTTGVDTSVTCANTGCGQYQATPGTSANAITTGNITPAVQPGLISAVAINVSTTNVISAGSGFTNDTVATGSTTGSIYGEYASYSALTAIPATFSQSTTQRHHRRR